MILSLYHHHYFVRIVNWYCISFKEKNEKCPYVFWVRLHVHGIVYKVVLRNMNLTFLFLRPYQDISPISTRFYETKIERPCPVGPLLQLFEGPSSRRNKKQDSIGTPFIIISILVYTYTVYLYIFVIGSMP